MSENVVVSNVNKSIKCGSKLGKWNIDLNVFVKIDTKLVHYQPISHVLTVQKCFAIIIFTIIIIINNSRLEIKILK